MHLRTAPRIFLPCALAAALLSAAPHSRAQAVNGYAEQLRAKPTRAGPGANVPYAPIRKPETDGQVPEIEMFVGESRVFPTPGVGRIAVGNGALLTAAALDGKEVILFANGVGTSSLFVWNEDGRYQRLKVSIVPGDTSRYAREIAAFLLTIPKARASIIGDKVIVEGDDLSDSDLGRIDLLAARYPQIVNFTNRLGFEQMVMIDVKVVEFPVTVLRELGLKWGSAGGAAIGGIWAPLTRGSGGPYQVNIVTGQGNAPPISNPDGSGNGLVLPGGLNIRSAINLGLNATLNALAQEGKTTILAEPQLSARNGSKANFLAGGEFPYTVSTINGPTVQFKPYGVKLDILPRADRNGTIRATIDTEFSQIDTSVTSPAGPALLSRKTSTEFNVRSGETIVLSGLVQRESSTSVDKVPYLGELPVLGALFRSKRFQDKETELVIFVTPTLVDSRTPGIVDRVQQANERLDQQLGPRPHLSEPLQPGRDPGRPDLPQPPRDAELGASGASGASGAAGTDDAQPSRLSPSLRSGAGSGSGGGSGGGLGNRSGRESGAASRTVGMALAQPVAAAAMLTLASAAAGSPYTVVPDSLAMRVTPDVNAPAMATLARGDLVLSLALPARGGWTAVQAAGRRGWVSSQWLQPVAPQVAGAGAGASAGTGASADAVPTD
jgi:pilus assembly protein CpaC